MAKIEKLTQAQEARLVEFREEWRHVGLSCDPADFASGDKVIRGFYKRLGKDEPLILHFSSPAMCELAVNLITGGDQLRGQLRGQLGDQLWDQLRGQLGDQLRGQLRGQLGDQLWDQLRGQLGDQLRGQLGDQLGDQLWDQLRGQLGDQLWDQLRGQLGDQLWDQFLPNSFDNQYNVAWEAFYLFGHEIGVKYKADDMALLLEWGRLAQSVGWWAPWDGICIVSDRPRLVKFDDERRLHREDGPAVTYSDGWSTYAWHGTRVPAEWIEDRSSLTPQIALSQDNLEQRRAACEILGWDTILSALHAKTIDEDGDPEIGSLVEVGLPGFSDTGAVTARYLRVRCGTGRQFAVCVPPDIDSAIAAQAWMLGLEPANFTKPEVRT